MAKMPSEPDHIDLDALDAFFLSECAPEKGVGLSDLGGFLTGVIVCPELLMPSELMPAIWAATNHISKNVDDTGAILGLTIVQYNEMYLACKLVLTHYGRSFEKVRAVN